MNTHKTLSIIIKIGIQEFGLQMPDLIDGDLTRLLQAKASCSCLVEVVLLELLNLDGDGDFYMLF